MSGDPIELDAAVGLLTRPSKHRVESAPGEFVWITADPLLLTLSLEIGNSSAAPKFKSSASNPIPIAADAYDLLSRITEEVAEHWWKTHNMHKGQGRTTLAGQLRAWTMVARSNPETCKEATRIVAGYVVAIRALLQPVRRWEIKGRCPSCGFDRVVDRIEEGEVFMRPALAVIYTPDGELSGAVCAGCSTAWASDQIKVLARIIASQEA